MKRILFALSLLLQYRLDLARYYMHKPIYKRLCDCPPQSLYDKGIRGLALDFDGVLASHGEIQPTKAIQAWLTTAAAVFGAEQMLILSNKPMTARIDWFAKHYPDMRWIRAARKKPYPDGLLQICTQTGLQPQQVILADDRLLTGGLAACLAGTQFLYIQQPYVQIGKRPVDELFFMSLRLLERRAVKILSMFKNTPR